MTSVDVTTYQDPGAIVPADAGQVTTLVRLAIEQRVPVEMLERLVALQERVAERDARAAFFEALVTFRDQCPPIRKTRENSQFEVSRNGVKRKAMYAPLEEIDRVARPIAAKHGLVWTWDTKVDDALMHISCRVIHVAGHSETTNVSMPYESKAGSSLQQKYGSTQTYGMRYSLIAALGITTVDEDDDGNGTAEEVEFVTEAQAADLEALADEVGVNKPKFLAWLGVESFAVIPAADLKRARTTLEAKR